MCGVYYIYCLIRVWSLLYVSPYECVVFTIFNVLLECGGYYMYRLMKVWCLVYLMPY